MPQTKKQKLRRKRKKIAKKAVQARVASSRARGLDAAIGRVGRFAQHGEILGVVSFKAERQNRRYP